MSERCRDSGPVVGDCCDSGRAVSRDLAPETLVADPECGSPERVGLKGEGARAEGGLRADGAGDTVLDTWILRLTTVALLLTLALGLIAGGDIVGMWGLKGEGGRALSYSTLAVTCKAVSARTACRSLANANLGFRLPLHDEERTCKGYKLAYTAARDERTGERELRLSRG